MWLRRLSIWPLGCIWMFLEVRYKENVVFLISPWAMLDGNCGNWLCWALKWNHPMDSPMGKTTFQLTQIMKESYLCYSRVSPDCCTWTSAHPRGKQEQWAFLGSQSLIVTSRILCNTPHNCLKWMHYPGGDTPAFSKFADIRKFYISTTEAQFCVCAFGVGRLGLFSCVKKLRNPKSQTLLPLSQPHRETKVWFVNQHSWTTWSLACDL